jgi:hypothetical protein
MYRKILLGLALIVAAPLAGAQEEWDWSVTPYLWAAGIDGEAGLGAIETDIGVDFADIVDVLAGAALVHVEARKDTYGLFGDLVFLSLESDPETATAGGRTETQFDTTIVELGYLKEASPAGLELGIRYWDLDLELQPTTLPSVERSEDWVDGFVGVRFEHEINDKWNWTTRANIGAGGSDFSLGFGTTFGRELGSGSQVVFGFKLLEVDFEKSSAHGIPLRIDTMFLGGTIGYAFD